MLMGGSLAELPVQPLGQVFGGRPPAIRAAIARDHVILAAPSLEREIRAQHSAVGRVMLVDGPAPAHGPALVHRAAAWPDREIGARPSAVGRVMLVAGPAPAHAPALVPRAAPPLRLAPR